MVYQKTGISIIISSCRYANLRGIECDLLTLTHRIPHFALLFRRLAEYERSRNVRLITMHGTTAVHQDDLPLLDCLRLHRAMRIGAGPAKQRYIPDADTAVAGLRRLHHAADVRRDHAGFEIVVDMPIGRHRNLTRFLH